MAHEMVDSEGEVIIKHSILENNLLSGNKHNLLDKIQSAYFDSSLFLISSKLVTSAKFNCKKFMIVPP